MIAALRRYWKSRTVRERAVLASAGVVLLVASYAWLVHTTDRARDRLGKSVMALRLQSDRLEQQAAEYRRLQSLPAATPSKTDLRTLVQGEAEASGLTREQMRIEASSASQVKVAVGAIPFADWIAWLGRLRSQHVRLEACRIEALSAAGFVSVTATLVREKSP